ncbi:DUF1462 family protein [Salinicoccus halitifaciens]|uniref:Disulfide oxidoreductase YuzD n=1 Tax=Salinicoccus halitifaciens TaxID=1073415 RepID=A0ABV2ECV2_9STAP|nr:DUF1462 family protein [Salinicoccus halitifaciens]MCD2138642.1 DUF1462 family protein [Salinicoccus halitifaciens]
MKFVINVYGRQEDGKSGLYGALRASLPGIRPHDDLFFNFIDIRQTDNLTDHDENLIEQLDEGDLVCPLVTINDEIASDGTTDPDTIIRWFEARG